jgi:hypothetical protein
MSQNKQIKEALLKGGKITALDAVLDYGCMRLAARIADLRDSGMNIKTTIIEKGNKRFAQYSLIQSEQK